LFSWEYTHSRAKTGHGDVRIYQFERDFAYSGEEPRA
jgi:hypothetical protein